MNSKPLQILLANDNEEECAIFSSALGQIPVNTALRVVYDGVELMEYLLENSEKLPDVLFLDICMPSKSGIEALHEIKRNPELSSLPVVVIAPVYHNLPEMEEQIMRVLYKLGAVSSIRKSDNIHSLKKYIQETLRTVPIKDYLPPPPGEFIMLNY